MVRPPHRPVLSHTLTVPFLPVQAIIFLAPLAFNLNLEEDPKINRLADSISIWKFICGSPLLANASLILFLNKMDILQATLASGVRVKDFVPSYGEGPNDLMNVTKCQPAFLSFGGSN